MTTMRFSILLFALVTGCSEEGPITDPHELGDCDKSWGGEAEQCEIACKKEPVQTEAGCPAVLRPDITNGFTNCTNGTFTIDTFRGCCLTNYPGHEGTALFAQCME